MLYPILLVYWGNKGGGLRFFQEALFEISEKYSTVVVSTTPSVHKYISENTKLEIINIGHETTSNVISHLSHIILRKYVQEVSRIKIELERNKIKDILVLMPFPGDLALNSLMQNGYNLMRVMHDNKPHLGEFWPTRFYIKKMLKCTHLITLSEYVFNQVAHENKGIASLCRQRYFGEIQKIENLPSRYVLSIGRNKKYKNGSLIKLLIRRNPNIIFVVNQNLYKCSKRPHNVNVLPSWLNDAEMEYAISNSALFLALYREASQSGVVEQALSWNVPCMVSNVGGLPEQVSRQGQHLIFELSEIHLIDETLRKIWESGYHKKLEYESKTTLYGYLEAFLIDNLY